MEMQDIIELNKKNIKQALEDYDKYTYKTISESVGDRFINDLAYDSAFAKKSLRDLFSKSPVWNEELQSIVINGTRTRNPDYEHVAELVYNILAPAVSKARDAYDYGRAFMIQDAAEFFIGDHSLLSEVIQKDLIEKLNRVAPNAYHKGRKMSKIFKILCQELGIVDETSGSEFQRKYAELADEFSAKKIDFKLYVSINPAHFITMSNPKGDSRGNTLTSCHSFNSTEYSYNNGCSGYARDTVTFIVFTAADDKDPESLNNRKTTRQIFAYKPGNGLLLQSRLYNTSGGTSGAQVESQLYRDLVQREISMLEGAVNLWKTYKYCSQNEPYYQDCIETGEGFGGYEDWIHPTFDAKVSIRDDCKDTYQPLTVGTYGLCIKCGCETSNGLFCEDCEHEDEYYCDECGEWHSTTTVVISANGNEINVCDDCLDRLYTYCEICDTYHHNNRITVVDDRCVCSDCFDEYCAYCDNCGEAYFVDDMFEAVDRYGNNVHVCSNCIDHYAVCDDCGEYHRIDDLYTVHDEEGNLRNVCESCRDENYTQCPDCEEWWDDSCVDEHGKCPNCAKKEEGAA